MLTRKLAETHRLTPSQLPLNLSILALEAVMYHFIIFAPFVRDVSTFNRVWRRDDTYSLLCQANPEGCDRLPRSPLLAGQYGLWRLAFETVVLVRSVSVEAGAADISDTKAMVQQTRSTLIQHFSTSEKATLEEQRSMADMYHVHCTALLLLLAMLEQPKPARMAEIKKLVQEGIQNFLRWNLNHVYLGGAGWGLQVLACGISDEDDWASFTAHVSRLVVRWDAGHRHRLQSVVQRVTQARANEARNSVAMDGSDRGLRLPGSLFLLRQSQGILYNGPKYS